MEELLRKFKEVAQHSHQWLMDTRSQTGQRFIGYFCTYAPEEIIHASGWVPVRILPSGLEISRANAHLQPYCCNLIKSALEAGLKGSLDFCDGFIFPHTCDAIQGLSDIWEKNLSFAFHENIILPVRLDTPSARDYLLQELQRFKHELERFVGNEITLDSLRESCEIYNHNRQKLRELYQWRQTCPGILRGEDILAIVKSSMYLPKQEHTVLLTELLQHLENKKTVDNSLVRLFISGGPCDDPRIWRMIEESGVVVVDDDLCIGSRYFLDDVENLENPFDGIVARFMKRVICPTKYNSTVEHSQYLLQKVKQCCAQGVIFLILKYCDPHLFEYPCLKKQLEDENIPLMLLELDGMTDPLERIRTRVQAFIEMLK